MHGQSNMQMIKEDQDYQLNTLGNKPYSAAQLQRHQLPNAYTKTVLSEQRGKAWSKQSNHPVFGGLANSGYLN